MIKLSDILKEVKTTQKATIKNSIQETSSKSMQLFVIEDVLNSGAFNKIESIALREFFEFRKSVPMLNENTVQMINKEMLKEGFFDWIKDKASQFKDALSGGWDKLKAAWSNFKDFIAGLVSQIKEAMIKIFKDVVAKIKASFNWTKDIAKKAGEVVAKNQEKAMQSILAKASKKAGKTPEEMHNLLPKEFDTLTQQAQYIVEFVTNNIVSVKDFAAKAIKGEKPPGDVEESIGLFKDKRLVETLIQINENEIDHPESLLKKYPRLQRLVTWIVKIWQWTFGIFGSIAKWVFKKIGENILGAINGLSKALKGPAIDPTYIALAALVAEIAEYVGAHNIHKGEKMVIEGIQYIAGIFKISVPVLTPFITALETIFYVTTIFFYVYAAVTIFINLLPAFKALYAWIKEKQLATKVAATS